MGEKQLEVGQNITLDDQDGVIGYTMGKKFVPLPDGIYLKVINTELVIRQGKLVDWVNDVSHKLCNHRLARVIALPDEQPP